MIASYQLTKEDYHAFLAHLQGGMGQPAKMINRLGWMFALTVLLPVIVLMLRPGMQGRMLTGLQDRMLPPILISAFLAIAAIVYVTRMARRMSSRLHSDEVCNAFCGPRELAIQPDALVEKKETWTIAHKWTTVERVAQTDSYLFIHSPQFAVSIIPRRAFATDSEFQKLVQTITDATGLKLEQC